MAASQLILYFSLGLVLCVVISARSKSPKLSHIPSVGPSGWVLSSLFVLRHLHKAWKVTKEGYDNAPDGVFRIPLVRGWLICCRGQQLSDDIRKAREDELSLFDALDEFAHMKLTLGEEIFSDPYHISVIRSTLTKSIPARFPDMRDEIVRAFDDCIVLEDGEWKAIHATNTILTVVSRVSNRVFVGVPLCRNPEFLNLTIQFTIDVMKTAFLIDLFPGFLKGVVGKYLTKLPYYVDQMSKYVMPIFRERLRMKAECNDDGQDKPNDYVSWLLDAVDGNQRSVRDLMLRILAISFGAIHTSSLAFTHALYDLAANTEYIPLLREEVESVVKQYGWTKAAIDHMVKADSFMRESQRLHPIATNVVMRKVIQDFTLSNGIVLPAGALVSLPTYATHRDELIYSDPDRFDPFRFSRQRGAGDDSQGARHQMAASNSENLTWGLGKHVCPGRYFAVVELKAMLAHVVMNYDIKMEQEGVRPPDLWLIHSCVPNRTAKVLFRKRLEK